MSDNEYDIELFFKALADRTRLRVLHLLGDDEVCVYSVVQALQATQPKISRHLAYLRRAGLVTARRQGKWMYYRIIDPPDSDTAEVFRQVRHGLTTVPQMERDRAELFRLTNGHKKDQFSP